MVQQFWRLVFGALIFAASVLAETLGQRYINAYLDVQEKAGHSLGSIVRMIATTAPYWVPIVAAIVCLIYVSWPTISKRLPENKRITGTVLRFEMLDAKDLSKTEFMELEQEFGKIPGFWYRALVEIDNHGASNRAKDWRFFLRRKDGKTSECTHVSKQWSAPDTWPRIQYCSLDEVRAQYLEPNHLYNVFMHIISPSRLDELDMRSFEVRFKDSSDGEIVGKMDGSIVPSWWRRVLDRFRQRPARNQVHFEAALKPTGNLDAKLTKASMPTTPIHFKDLGGAVDAAQAAGNNTVAAQIFAALLAPTSLRQQTFDLVEGMKHCIVYYHRSLDAEGLMSPEISKSFTTPLLAARDKLVKALHMSPTSLRIPMPLVRAMVKFLSEVETAAFDLKTDIKPVLLEDSVMVTQATGEIVQTDEPVKAGVRTQARDAIAKLPLIPDISDRTFALVKALRETMIGCHGSLDADAETDDEMRLAFEVALLDLKPLLEARLGKPIPMPDTGMITVSGVVELAKDLERAAAIVQSAAPPGPAPTASASFSAATVAAVGSFIGNAWRDSEKFGERKWFTGDPLGLMDVYAIYDEARADEITAQHKGEWLPVSGKIRTVGHEYNLWMGMRRVTFGNRRNPNSLAYDLYFDQEWSHALDRKSIGEEIDIVGRIESIGKYWITLKYCALEQS